MTISRNSLGAHYDFQSQFLQCGTYRLHYLDEGQGEPVVMLHGNPTWSFLYRGYIASLRDSYRLIVPDHVGCGFSDRPSESIYRYTLLSRVEDLERLLVSLDLHDNLTLVLHDWGGLIGAAYAARHPASIRRLIIFNTAGFLLPADKRLHWTLRFARDSRLAAYLMLKFNVFARVATVAGCPGRPMPREIRRCYLKACDSAESRLVTLRFVQDIPFSEGDPAYPAALSAQNGLALLSRVPVLICWGERDFVFDSDFLTEWVRYFPNAEVHRFPKAGHYVLEEEFEGILPLVRNFLDRSRLS